MHISADNSLSNFVPAFVLGGSANGSAPGSAPTNDCSIPLIDWKACLPDGSDQSLGQVLNALASRFQGEVYLVFQSPGSEPQHYASHDWPTGIIHSSLRSTLAEALHSRTNWVFAAASGQSSLVLQQLRQAWEATLLLGFGSSVPSAPVPSDAGNLFGLVVCIRRIDQLQTKDEYAELVDHTRRELQAWMHTWQLCRLALQLKKWYRRLGFYRRRRGQLGLVALGLFLASLALPVPYWPQRACVVEPASRSFISSPVDGRLRNAVVRPGDVVQPGQVLATLDDEPLRWQLSAAEAEYESASKKRDSALALRAGGELRLAQLEQERIAIQIESLQRQLEQLELRSPIHGVLVQGDWYQSDGAPVTRGEMLFEIAAMDRMRVEIHLSTDDLARIEADSEATLRVDAAPGNKWSSIIERIDPRGKVVDSQVVFAANLEVDNQTNQLRPGMKGTARITAGTQSLGWLLFHRPALWTMKKLAW